MLGYTNLAEFYKVLWRLSYTFNMSITELELMLPYERDIYIDMTITDIQKQLEKKKK